MNADDNHTFDLLYAPHLLVHKDVVLGTSCRQSKHTTLHVLPRQKMPTANFAKAKDAIASFVWATDPKGNLQPTIYVYEKI